MITTRLEDRRMRNTAAALLLAGATGGLAVPLDAQAERLAVDGLEELAPIESEKNALERGRYAVLIDLDENMLYFKEGEVTLWSAPVGTGTAMRVITEEERWDFSTPTGRFQVQYKERDPIWIAPDWYFVENNLPVPPKNHPSRNMTGTLGVAAVYISPSLAIHGTNRPELIGQRVSHGCIRLENRYAMRLYNNVQVGTEVIIVGGEEALEEGRVVDLREGYDPSLASRGGRRTLPLDPVVEGWKELDTDELLEELDEELERSPRRSRWDEVVAMIVDRASDDDEVALAGLFSRAAGLPSERVEREWGTFLVEAYRRVPLQTLETLGELRSRQRQQAADLVVDAMLTLYFGDFDAPSTPWPSSRVTHSKLSRDASQGLEALLSAEREHRERIFASLQPS